MPTRAEHLMWQALRGRKLDGVKFRRQHPLGPYIVDFYSGSQGLVVEIDGPGHAEKRDLDAKRQAFLEREGLRFVRLSADDVEENLDVCLRRIRAAFR